MTTTPQAYAVAYLREVDLGPQIIDYINRIDETLAEFGGRFIVHGGQLTPLEGTWDGDLVVIEFPSRAAALEWYDSPAYQAILPLRTEHSDGIATIVDGVQPGYRAADKLAQLLTG
ncbi:DUF1330 domain-containing protein [Nocardioides sp.]|uniref:DUF1330 domain-containing protein n=1 Tax=Nocardioides sp. TaxID=35761 RepID=UPI002735EA15|nr:DUF1330 domain-containing protein [Nocardioides sp.]MDP3890765.1 DUF1330 domain-containing protein [Nocardioides sp.]